MLYQIVGSFVKYLVDEYGIDKFMQVHDSKDLYEDYEKVYEKKLEKLR